MASVANSLSLNVSLERYIQGNGSVNCVLKDLYGDTRVISIVMVCATRRGLGSLKSELVQDTICLFHEKYLSRPGKLNLPDAESIYSLIYAIAENVVMSKYREFDNHRIGAIHLDDMSWGYSDSRGEMQIHDHANNINLEDPEEFESSEVLKLDTRRAEQEFTARLSDCADNDLGRMILRMLEGDDTQSLHMNEVDLPEQVLVSSTPKVRKDTPEHVELRETRKLIGAGLKEYAGLLSCSMDSLSAYLYNRTAAIPDDIIKACRKAKADHESRFKSQKEMFDDIPMLDIVDRWLEIIGLSKSGDWKGALSDILGIRPITVRRWLKDDYRPSVQQLVKYQGVLETHAANAALIQMTDHGAL